MLQIEWCEEYGIDKGIIDEEHKSLIEMANQIFAIEHPESQREEMIDLVKSLYRYMETHFAHEEDLMEQADVPDREDHARMHRFLAAEMTRALKTHSDLREYAVVLRKLIGEWFVNHIVSVDRRIASQVTEAAR